MEYAIVTDTSANLPSGLVQRMNIDVIPFSYCIDGKSYACMDTQEFDGARFYGAMRKGLEVTTSQITPQQYIESMRPILQEGRNILFVGMSSGISGSYNCAEIAAQELRTEFPAAVIRLVDSLGASLGEGLLAVRAAEYRDEGLSLDETADRLLGERENVCQVFTVDDLKYLHKGGRLSNVAAVVGTVLNIKPILKGDECGRIVSIGKVRGIRRAIETLAAKYDALVHNAQEQLVGIAHADCLENAEYLKTLLNLNHPPKEILTVCYEPVTGSHVGPGALALFFCGGPRVRFE